MNCSNCHHAGYLHFPHEGGSERCLVGVNLDDRCECPQYVAPSGVVLPCQSTAFVKHDSGKVRYGLVPAHVLESVAKVFTLGAKKYGENNYLKGTNWSRYIDAAFRHIEAWRKGEGVDGESNESHLAHAICCLSILLELERLNLGTDDRETA